MNKNYDTKPQQKKKASLHTKSACDEANISIMEATKMYINGKLSNCTDYTYFGH